MVTTYPQTRTTIFFGNVVTNVTVTSHTNYIPIFYSRSFTSFSFNLNDMTTCTDLVLYQPPVQLILCDHPLPMLSGHWQSMTERRSYVKEVVGWIRLLLIIHPIKPTEPVQVNLEPWTHWFEHTKTEAYEWLGSCGRYNFYIDRCIGRAWLVMIHEPLIMHVVTTYRGCFSQDWDSELLIVVLPEKRYVRVETETGFRKAIRRDITPIVHNRLKWERKIAMNSAYSMTNPDFQEVRAINCALKSERTMMSVVKEKKFAFGGGMLIVLVGGFEDFPPIPETEFGVSFNMTGKSNHQDLVKRLQKNKEEEDDDCVTLNFQRDFQRVNDRYWVASSLRTQGKREKKRRRCGTSRGMPLFQ